MKMDMTKGSPLRLILVFAIPLFLGNLFQQCYNLADTAMVGHLLGNHSLSAMGAVSSLYGLALSLCFGMTNGFSILIARYFGAKQEREMKQSIAATVVLSVGFTVLMTILCMVFLKPLLHFLHTPADIFQEAYQYIAIILSGCVVTILYNMLASILRALGNSLIPLMFLIFSSFLNIGLDWVFLKLLGTGVAGAAYATILAQLISGILCLLYIWKKVPMVHLKREDFHFSWELLREILLSGAAMSLMFAVVNMGTVILQTGINGLGTTTIAAHSIARKISELFMMVSATLAGTMTTYTSQNYGAGEMRRIWQGVKVTHLLGWIWSTLLVVLVFFFAEEMIGLLSGSTDAALLATGASYLRLNIPFYYFLFILCILRNTLQGMGCKIFPVIGSLMEMLGKLATVQFFVKPFGYTAICFCEPVTWILCGAMVTAVFFLHPQMRNCFRKENPAF